MMDMANTIVLQYRQVQGRYQRAMMTRLSSEVDRVSTDQEGGRCEKSGQLYGDRGFV